jgi:probable HAF family extracellular repeat protein
MSVSIRKCFAALAAVPLALGVAGECRAEWSFSWLGHLPRDERSFPHAVSADGSVVVGESILGEYHTNYQPEAFRWTEAQGMAGLDFLPGHAWSQAYDVSADGSVVVGYSQASIGEHGIGEAFRWTQSGGMSGLGYLPGDHHSWATGVSADGSVVVGFSGGLGETPRTAFRWIEGTGMEDLGWPDGGAWSRAVAVSADGSAVVGQWGTATEWRGAFYWTEDGGMVDLGSLPGGGVDRVYDLSADGSLVLGTSPTLGTVTWTEETGMVGLEFEAEGVSEDRSLFVGVSDGRPALRDATHGVRNLTELLLADGVELEPDSLQTAYDVSSNDEKIMVTGAGFDREGFWSGWTATYVIPEPSSVMLAIAGLLGLPAYAWRMRRRTI